MPKMKLRINDEFTIFIRDKNSEVRTKYDELIISNIEKTKLGRVNVFFKSDEIPIKISLRNITIDEAMEFRIAETYKVTINNLN